MLLHILPQICWMLLKKCLGIVLREESVSLHYDAVTCETRINIYRSFFLVYCSNIVINLTLELPCLINQFEVSFARLFPLLVAQSFL